MAKQSKIVKNQKEKRFGNPIKVVNRCQICGRPRGYIRQFGLCRLCFRELAHKGQIPGVVKASK